VGEAARVPGQGWYVFAGAIAIATVAAIAAVGVWLFFEFSGAEQFLVPGRHAVELKKPGGYLVWNDHRTVFQGRSYDESKHLPRGARISVIDKASGRELEVGSHSGATNTTGSTESVSVAQFSVSQPGAYEVVIEGDFPPRVFSVGRNFAWQMVGGIFGGVALLTIGFGAALAIAGWTFLRRREAADAVAPAARPAPATPDAREKSLRQLTAIVYGLQIAAFFVGITMIAAVIVNYVKRRDVEGTWLESHFRWQIRTFWYSLLWLAVGLATLIVLVGFLVLIASACWALYRAIRGWIALEDGKPMYSNP
jgi:uncharacterized membrane protein